MRWIYIVWKLCHANLRGAKFYEQELLDETLKEIKHFELTKWEDLLVCSDYNDESCVKLEKWYKNLPEFQTYPHRIIGDLLMRKDLNKIKTQNY